MRAPGCYLRMVFANHIINLLSIGTLQAHFELILNFAFRMQTHYSHSICERFAISDMDWERFIRMRNAKVSGNGAYVQGYQVIKSVESKSCMRKIQINPNF